LAFSSHPLQRQTSVPHRTAGGEETGYEWTISVIGLLVFCKLSNIVVNLYFIY